MGLFLFHSKKETGELTNRYKDQIYVVIKKEDVLWLISNIAKNAMESDKDSDTIDIPFAGSLENLE